MLRLALFCCVLCCFVPFCVVPLLAVSRFGRCAFLRCVCRISARCVVCAVCVLAWCVGACCCSPMCPVLCVSWNVLLCVPCPLRSVRCLAALWCCACFVVLAPSVLFLALGAVVRCCVLCFCRVVVLCCCCAVPCRPAACRVVLRPSAWVFPYRPWLAVLLCGAGCCAALLCLGALLPCAVLKCGAVVPCLAALFGFDYLKKNCKICSIFYRLLKIKQNFSLTRKLDNTQRRYAGRPEDHWYTPELRATVRPCR